MGVYIHSLLYINLRSEKMFSALTQSLLLSILCVATKNFEVLTVIVQKLSPKQIFFTHIKFNVNQ